MGAQTITQGNLGERRYDLDWVRIGAFMLLIFYHVGMYYVPWDWHVKSQHTSSAIEPLMMLTEPWRLSLLFLISGVATAYLFERQGARGFLGQRSVLNEWRCPQASSVLQIHKSRPMVIRSGLNSSSLRK